MFAKNSTSIAEISASGNRVTSAHVLLVYVLSSRNLFASTSATLKTRYSLLGQPTMDRGDTFFSRRMYSSARETAVAGSWVCRITLLTKTRKGAEATEYFENCCGGGGRGSGGFKYEGFESGGCDWFERCGFERGELDSEGFGTGGAFDNGVFERDELVDAEFESAGFKADGFKMRVFKMGEKCGNLSISSTTLPSELSLLV